MVLGKWKGKPMEGVEMAMGGSDPATMHEGAKERVPASASATALGEQAPTGVWPPLSLLAGLPGDGQQGPPDATRSTWRRSLRQRSRFPGRRQVLQQMQAHSSQAKGGGSTTTTLLTHSHQAQRPSDQDQQPNALPANVHSSVIPSNQPTDRDSPTSTRPPTPTPVQPVASTT